MKRLLLTALLALLPSLALGQGTGPAGMLRWDVDCLNVGCTTKAQVCVTVTTIYCCPDGGPDFVACGSAGGGDVSGPASSIDNALARFDGVGGKTIQGFTSNPITATDAEAQTNPNGVLTLGNASNDALLVLFDTTNSCLDIDTDRLYGDLDCSGTKGGGEEYLDQTGGGLTHTVNADPLASTTAIDFANDTAGVPAGSVGVLWLKDAGDPTKVTAHPNAAGAYTWTGIHIFNAIASFPVGFTSGPSANRTIDSTEADGIGPVKFPRGIGDVGPIPMIVFAADNHGQQDTYTDFLTLVDQYDIPFTIHVSRRLLLPAAKASAPGATDDLTNTELIAISTAPLWELSTHGGWHLTGSLSTSGYVSNINSTNVTGYNLAVGFNAQPDDHDIVWFYGGGGPQYIDGTPTDFNHLAVNESPGINHGKQFYYIDDRTVSGTVDCDGDATALITSADPDGQILAAPTFAGTGRGGLMWIETATNGNPYYVLDYNAGTNVITFNRPCFNDAALPFHLGISHDAISNDLMESIDSIRTDIGDSTYRIESYGCPNDELSIQKPLEHLARGITTNVCATGTGFHSVAIGPGNRLSLDRSTPARGRTPEELRNWVRSAIDAKALLVFNFESSANPALLDPTSLGTRDAGVSTEWDCDDVDCDFVVNGVEVGDLLIIDDPLVVEDYIVTIVAAETLTVGEAMPATVAAANFWIVDIDDPDATAFSAVFETIETLFAFVDSVRDQIMPMKLSDAADRMDMLSSGASSSNLIQNPLFRVNDGEELGTDTAGASPYAPWIFDHDEGSNVTRVERFGTPMLKVDFSAGTDTLDITQRVVFEQGKHYIVWSEVEVESIGAGGISVIGTDMLDIEGAMSSGGLSDTLTPGGKQNRIFAETDADGEQTYVSYYAFSTETPAYYQGTITDGAGAATGPTNQVGFLNLAQVLNDTGGDDGVTVLTVPGQVQEVTSTITALDADRYCIPTPSTSSSNLITVTCYEAVGRPMDSDYSFVIYPEPAQAAFASMRDRRTARVRMRFTGQGVIYWRPVVVVEDTNWIER